MADTPRNVDLFDDIFVEKNPAAQPENAVEEQHKHTQAEAFEKGGLTLTMALSKDQLSPEKMEITQFLNHTIADFNTRVPSGGTKICFYGTETPSATTITQTATGS